MRDNLQFTGAGNRSEGGGTLILKYWSQPLALSPLTTDSRVKLIPVPRIVITG